MGAGERAGGRGYRPLRRCACPADHVVALMTAARTGTGIPTKRHCTTHAGIPCTHRIGDVAGAPDAAAGRRRDRQQSAHSDNIGVPLGRRQRAQLLADTRPVTIVAETSGRGRLCRLCHSAWPLGMGGRTEVWEAFGRGAPPAFPACRHEPTLTLRAPRAPPGGSTRRPCSEPSVPPSCGLQA